MKHQQGKSYVVEIFVTDHARERARERFPGFKAARIIDEVRIAIHDGKIGALKPAGFNGPPRADCLYAWNDRRAYALKAVDNGLVVTTTVARSSIGGS